MHHKHELNLEYESYIAHVAAVFHFQRIVCKEATKNRNLLPQITAAICVPYHRNDQLKSWKMVI